MYGGQFGEFVLGYWRLKGKSNRYFFIFPIFTMAIEMGEGPGQADRPLPPNFQTGSGW